MDYMGLRVVKIIFYVIIFFLSFVGNSLVVVIIFGVWDMCILLNFFILNLVLCDLIILIVDILFDFVLEESKYIWCFGKVLCKIIWLLEIVFIIFLLLIFVIISLEWLKVILYFFIKCL